MQTFEAKNDEARQRLATTLRAWAERVEKEDEKISIFFCAGVQGDPERIGMVFPSKLEGCLEGADAVLQMSEMLPYRDRVQFMLLFSLLQIRYTEKLKP